MWSVISVWATSSLKSTAAEPCAWSFRIQKSLKIPKSVPEALKATVVTWTNVGWVTGLSLVPWPLQGERQRERHSLCQAPNISLVSVGNCQLLSTTNAPICLKLLHLNLSFLNKLSHPKCASQGNMQWVPTQMAFFSMKTSWTRAFAGSCLRITQNIRRAAAPQLATSPIKPWGALWK